jgi:predicted  nucleic acid-binding Zn-ribbon protein
MSFMDDLKATAGQVIKKVGDTVGDLKERASLELQIRPYKTQITQTQDAVRSCHEELGRRVHDLYRQNQITDDPLLTKCKEIDELTRRLEDLTAQINKLREEHERAQAATHEDPNASGSSGGHSGSDGGNV